MTKWTPGPWIAEAIEASGTMARVYISNFRVSDEERDATLRLIEAAPEMAELLSRLIADDVTADEYVWPWQQDARALLARIEDKS